MFHGPYGSQGIKDTPIGNFILQIDSKNAVKWVSRKSKAAWLLLFILREVRLLRDGINLG